MMAAKEEGLRWSDLVAAIGPDRMEEPGPMGEWTFKDLAAHLTGWRERSIRRLEVVAEMLELFDLFDRSLGLVIAKRDARLLGSFEHRPLA